MESIYASTTFLVTCNNRTWNTYFKAIFQSPIYKEYYVHTTFKGTRPQNMASATIIQGRTAKNLYKYFKVMVRNPKKMGILLTLVYDRIINENCERR